MRFGKEGAPLDNADSGGMYCAVSPEGVLQEKAFVFIGRSVVENPHAGHVMPDYRKAVELVTSLHALMPQLFTIGWDVAYTDDGPVVVEGNDGWDPGLNQKTRGHQMRGIWDELLAEREANLGKR